MIRKVILKPNNKRLKQLIKEHGELWSVDIEARPVQCFNGGLGVFISTVGHSRWVKPEDIEDV